MRQQTTDMSGAIESSSAEGRKRKSSPSTEIQGPSTKYQAEHWREQENRYIKELAELVSANIGEVNSFNVLPDKCAVLRETVSQIRRVGLREREKETANLNQIQQSDVSSSGQDVVDHEELGPFLLEALDAFFFVVAQDGKIVFASENVGRFLNCSREELMYRSVYSILHPSDHAEFLHNLMPQGYANGVPNGRGGSTFVCRILTQHSSLPDGAAGPGQNCCTVQCFTALHSSTIPADSGDVQTCLLCVLRPIPERPPVETQSFSTRQDINGKVIGIEAMKLRSVVKVGWEQLVRGCLQAFYYTSLVQQHHMQVKTKGLALSPPYQFSLPDGSMFTAQTRSKLHHNTSLHQDPFIQSLHVLHREISPGNLQRDPTQSLGLCPQPSSHGTSSGHPATTPLSQLPSAALASGWEPSAEQLAASSVSGPKTMAHSSGNLSTSTQQFEVSGVPQCHLLGSQEIFPSQNDGASSPTNSSHSGLSQTGLLLSSCRRASPGLNGDSPRHLVKSSSGLNNQIPSNMPLWKPQLSTEGQPGLSLITPGARLEPIRPLKQPKYKNIIGGVATQSCPFGKSPTRTEVQMGSSRSSDETNGPNVQENNALSGGKSSTSQKGLQTSLVGATKEKESTNLSTENTAQIPLVYTTQSLTDRHKILHQLLQENDKNPSIQTSVGEPTTLDNNNKVSVFAPKNDKGGMQKKEKHILLRYLLDKEEPCNPSSPPLGFGPHSKVDEEPATTAESGDHIDSSQNSINIKCNPSEKEREDLNSAKQADDTEPLQQTPEGEANRKDLNRVFEAESQTTQCTPVTFSLASNVRRSMGRSLSATCSPIGLPTNQGVPFARPVLMRSHSTIAGATSDIGVCSRPHGGQGSFFEPSQASPSSRVTEAMLGGTTISVQTSGTGQLSEEITQPMCMTNMERAWLGHESRTSGGGHRADLPRMTRLSASSPRQIQGSMEQALGRPYHLTNCSEALGPVIVIAQ
uniref:nuclear receptor coactivator 2-like isoform X2 n=1 Tax=Myxine glutinosa TaxID=7769 RepID=UPI00358F84B0